ncbi:uncharacterized protein MKK02DRAFT_42658 [Dioszegia hungarica]|uniref:LIM zinc-binding domain-containing protein n=1 Tax=Dioszegia hungarica TaxID=4972 RepID=A0AA38HB99_9TREE|nr:uncharacterized protein MKK02DRAFT_42658 [Dioszegia hungarica]KAI9638267.1 hypothetical protein MKK02DRAFT_42658 [Dioszegia hungarica]
MIVCCHCGEKGFSPHGRCGKCGARTIQRRSSFNTPLQNDRDRWANRYVIPDASSTSPHLRRQTVPIAHLPKLREEPPATATRPLPRPIKPHHSPFEVHIDDADSPSTLNQPIAAPVMPALQAKSVNVLRPNLGRQSTGLSAQYPLDPSLFPTSALVAPLVPPKHKDKCDHGCGCGKLAEDINPRKPDPHGATKKRLFGDLQRVCQRPGSGIPPVGLAPPLPNPPITIRMMREPSYRRPSSPLNLPAMFARLQRDTAPPTPVNPWGPLGTPLPPPTPSDARNLRYQPPSRTTPLTAPPTPRPDYLPLTSVPQDLSPRPRSNSLLRTHASQQSAEDRFGSFGPGPTIPPSTRPLVHIDVVPPNSNRTESVSERRASYMRAMSRGTANVAAPSEQIASGRRVAELREAYEQRKAEAQRAQNRRMEEVSRKLAQAPPRPWPPVTARDFGAEGAALGRQSPRPRPNAVAETRERYASQNGQSEAGSNRSARVATWMASLPGTDRAPPGIPLRQVPVSTVNSSRRTSANAVSRAASITSTDTVIVHNLSPVLPPINDLQIRHFREVANDTLPTLGRKPGYRLSSTSVPKPRIPPTGPVPSNSSRNSNSVSTVRSPHLRDASASSTRPAVIPKLGGNMPPCPCCGVKIAFFDRDRVVGPYGTVWHQSCLQCGGGEGAGRGKLIKGGCGKRLDKGANVDLGGTMWCKKCSLERKARVLVPSSVSPALPTQPLSYQQATRLASLRHPQPVRLSSPDISMPRYRWPSSISRRSSQGRRVTPSGPRRASWCSTGTGGV